MTMARLLSSYDLGHISGESHTIIRVRNLQTVLPIGTDAWGRPHKSQPVLISASISLSQPFSSASETDTVTNSTVHYGILSKAILKACGEFEKLYVDGAKKEKKNEEGEMDVYTLVMYLQAYLKGVVETMQGKGTDGMRMLEIEVKLPKGSLLGSGVSLKGSFLYGDHAAGEKKEGPSAHSMVMRLTELKIPTLIGVNSNERLAKQMVIASVEMERWNRIADGYCELEEIVVKTIEESSFETLEALSSHLSTNIIKYFIIPHFTPEARAECIGAKGSHNHQRIRISLEKPTAVMFADAPVVEVLVDSDPSKSQVMRMIWESTVKPVKPPFPLRGTLGAWESGQKDGKE